MSARTKLREGLKNAISHKKLIIFEIFGIKNVEITLQRFYHAVFIDNAEQSVLKPLEKHRIIKDTVEQIKSIVNHQNK